MGTAHGLHAGESPRPLVRTVPLAFLPVDLSTLYNNRATSEYDRLDEGAFNVWGNSFPARELPTPGEPFDVAGVPFVRGAPTDAGDNVRCDGQYVEVPASACDWVHLVVAGERRAEAEVALHHAEGEVEFEALRVSDFWAEAPAVFGELAVTATAVTHYPHHVQPRLSARLWAQRVPVVRSTPLQGIRLPRHVAVHVFALTLQGTARENVA